MHVDFSTVRAARLPEAVGIPLVFKQDTHLLHLQLDLSLPVVLNNLYVRLLMRWRFIPVCLVHRQLWRYPQIKLVGLYIARRSTATRRQQTNAVVHLGNFTTSTALKSTAYGL